MPEPKKQSNVALWIVGCAVLVLVGVFVVGILAAIAIPAFVDYARRAKTVEAQTNVHMIMRGLESYCEERGTLPAPIAPAFVPSATRHVVMLEPAWQAVGFVAPDPLYYAYAIERPDAQSAIISAEGDLDDDGVRSRFASTCTLSGPSCTCGEIVVTNELE